MLIRLQIRHTQISSPVHQNDTDVFLLLIAFCQKYTHPFYFDTGMENNRKMINIQTHCQKIDKDVQDAILGLHAFTSCDVNNAFVQKGKPKPLDILIKDLEYAPVSYTSTNKLRHDIVRQKYIVRGKGVLSCIEGLDISLLPPCRTALKFHSLHANYQTLIK